MGIYTDAIQKLYVAYFNRPADYAGLANWESVLTANKGDISVVSKAFAGSDEYKKAYAGMDAYHVVAQVYLNLFNNPNPDLPGLTFWASKLQAGVLSIDTIVKNIADGAQGTDLAAYNAKVSAATAFTAQLDTAQEILGYSGDVANGLAKTWMSTIKDDATLKAAIADAALAATVNSVTNPPVPGQTFNLTQGLDTVNGTAGDDVINAFAFNNITGAAATTLNSVDTTNGGNGNDTLNIEVTAANNNNLTGITTTSVETISFNESQAVLGATLNASAFAGAKTINQIGASVDVSKLAAGTTASFQSQALTAAANRTVAAAASASSASVNLGTAVTGDAANNAVLNVNGASLSSVTVSGVLTKADSTLTNNKLTLNLTSGTDAAGNSVASVAVNTAVTTTLALTEQGTGHVATVDASGSTGGVTYAGSQYNSTIKGGAGKDTLTLATKFSATVTSASIDGGAGNDKIYIAVDSSAASGTFTANGGDGNDVINAAQINLAAGNKIDGGAGTDTLKLSMPASYAFAAGDYVLLSSVVSNVETLEMATSVTGLSGAKVAQFTNLTFDADASGVTSASQAILAHGNLTAAGVGYLSAAATGDVANYAGDLKVTADTTGKTISVLADTATVNVDTTGKYAGVADTIKGDLQTGLTVNVVNSTDGGSPVGADYLAAATIAVDGANAVDGLSALKSITLKGDGTVTLSSTGAAKLATIDASALGGTLKATGVAGNITGGLNFTGNSAVAESITLGSGHDVLTIASTYSKMDTITGFDANLETTDATSTNDVLTFGGVTMGDTVLGHATLAKVALTAAESTLDLAFIKAAAASHAAADAVVFFQFGGNTYLFKDANSNGILDNSDLAVKLVGTYDLTKDFSAHATPAV
ncbi:DUF4214 domain-containing protein [Massilia agilis]|uniref:DUF4214 domain-containing protein n=1 Tax=Massilia agilis TaxID=1811226 RepID=A0ABT2DHL6_9BURK|nr:DUF4214 domain-containing protein [Massilia agilis]MCS0809946.1 DUF4214 domain-containing protein [Massilia agilis]